MELYFVIQRCIPALIIAAIAVFAYAMGDHISKMPRPPGADPWHDERKKWLGVLALVLALAALALYAELFSALGNFFRALVAPVVRGIFG